MFVPYQARDAVLEWGYASKFACNPGGRRTLEFIPQCFWWPSIVKDVPKFVAACTVCAQNKTPQYAPSGLLQPGPTVVVGIEHETYICKLQLNMDLSSCPAPVLIGDDSLQTWRVIGAGGFGQIHKARHIEWGLDVAVKLLHANDGSSTTLLREADLMRQGGNPYVLRILGVYKGCPPSAGCSSQLGLVMEFMERGSLAALQECLSGHPPWPLSFRLAHQVALGMNFLHHLNPPLLHLDLKPSNVLLDDSLHAKASPCIVLCGQAC
ncbi:hypothetical protein DPEC_G00096470 [Dallia pectoralis]|uniref:Uncharacterized protein n=1 Tax=Dallia pectoralis TaxID=75939 RepID=A0ACC2GW73_DALPE|nr:hypothetical protein DPEC_G00096470 [Dallia pectoralis]